MVSGFVIQRPRCQRFNCNSPFVLFRSNKNDILSFPIAHNSVCFLPTFSLSYCRETLSEKMQTSQGPFTTMVYEKFGGQTE